MFPPVVIFTFYQWTLKDSWLSIFFSVLLLLSVVGCIIHSAFITLRVIRQDMSYSLFTNIEHLAAHGPLYAQYRPSRYYFSILLISATLLKASLVAFAKANGEVQVIFLVVVEFGIVAAHLVLKPYKTRGGDVLASYLAIVRFVCTGLMIAFIETLAVAAIPRVAIGIIAAVLFSIAVVVLFINIAAHLPGVRRLFKSSQRSQQDSAVELMMEKGDISSSSTESQTHRGRPSNPTLQRNTRMDLHVNQPYPEITRTQIVAESQSPVSVDTSSTILPLRWSFQLNSQSEHSTSPQSTNFSSTPSTPSRIIPPQPLVSNGHGRQHSS